MRNVAKMINRCRKAGLSGFFLMLALFMSTPPVSAQPIQLEVTTANVGFDPRTNEPLVTLRLTPASAKLFSELTSKSVGRPMAFSVDGNVLMKPVIREPILGGSLQIAGNMTAADAKTLAERLASGKGRLAVEVLD